MKHRPIPEHSIGGNCPICGNDCIYADVVAYIARVVVSKDAKEKIKQLLEEREGSDK
jgi:hypothetical protein